MKKNDIPQDPSALDNVSRDVWYVTDEAGNYTTGLSRGWEVKATALNIAWQDIEQRVEEAKKQVEQGLVSPIQYFMEAKIMDLGIVSAYTGFWKWQIKRHLKPSVFTKLSDKKIAKYASLFEVSVDELKSMNTHAN